MRCAALLLAACLGCAPTQSDDVPVPLTAYGLTARVEGDSIVCHRAVDGDPIRYMTFERSGDEAAYGVYGLAGPKNGLPVDLPLGGDPIAWDDRDHVQALAHLLELAGMQSADAARWVDANTEEVFAEGLRVLFAIGSPVEIVELDRRSALPLGPGSR